MNAAIPLPAKPAKSPSFVNAWAIIDGVIDRNADYKNAILAQVNTIAASESIQRAADWACAFEAVYKKVAKYPALRFHLEKQLKQRAKAESLGAACEWFKDFELKYLRINTSTSFMTVESRDGVLRDEAEAMAQRSERMMMEKLAEIKAGGFDGKYVMKAAERLALAICNGVGIDLPKVGIIENEKEEMAALCARLFCPKWWRRQLRTLQARKLETAARELGLVCKRMGGYCSLPTLKRRAGQKRRNEELLKMMEAENDSGQVFTLDDLAKRGVSNPVIRRNELMTRIRGFEEVAEEIGGWTPVFFTQTCPSRYHSHNRAGVRYENWDGSTPRDAQEYLTDVWAKTRAALARADVAVFGFRVAEPHHDGCPHWHSLLWFQSHQVEKAIAIYKAYCMQDTPPPAGKEEVRFKAMRDELASGATSYIAKYISKNVDGMTESGEAWSADVVKTAVRTEAWATTWGIRQFQQIGGASVTVWREMRRLNGVCPEAGEIESICTAAHEGNWKQYTLEMGGPVKKLQERPIRAYMVLKRDEAGEMLKNAYGELTRQLKGLEAFGWLPIKTRFHEWVVRPVRRGVEVLQAAHAPPLDLCQ